MTRRNATVALGAAAGLSLLLHLLPAWIPALAWLGWPLTLLSTLFHELGHGFAALLVGGGFETLRIYPDASGVATTLSDGSRPMRAAIAAGGPLAPPLFALLLFIGARHERSARVALWLLAALLAASLVLWVRGLFGIGFVLVLLALLAAFAAMASARLAQIVTCFLAIELSLAAFARADYLFAAEARTGLGTMPSDTAQIAQALLLPHWVWGGAIALVSLLVLCLGLLAFARAMRATQPDLARSPATATIERR